MPSMEAEPGRLAGTMRRSLAEYTEKLDYELSWMYIAARKTSGEKASEHIGRLYISTTLVAAISKAGDDLASGSHKAKDFEASKIMGPCLVTVDELQTQDLGWKCE